MGVRLSRVRRLMVAVARRDRHAGMEQEELPQISMNGQEKPCAY